MILSGPTSWAEQYPKLWAFRPSLSLTREAFVAACAGAAESAAEVAVPWYAVTAFEQPKGPNGLPLFATDSAWFLMLIPRRREVWRTWLRSEWLIDWIGANRGPEKAKGLRTESAKVLEKGTKQQKDAGKFHAEPWMWVAGAGVLGFVVWRLMK
jgi:hypothetical protein